MFQEIKALESHCVLHRIMFKAFWIFFVLQVLGIKPRFHACKTGTFPFPIKPLFFFNLRFLELFFLMFWGHIQQDSSACSQPVLRDTLGTMLSLGLNPGLPYAKHMSCVSGPKMDTE